MTYLAWFVLSVSSAVTVLIVRGRALKVFALVVAIVAMYLGHLSGLSHAKHERIEVLRTQGGEFDVIDAIVVDDVIYVWMMRDGTPRAYWLSKTDDLSQSLYRAQVERRARNGRIKLRFGDGDAPVMPQFLFRENFPPRKSS